MAQPQNRAARPRSSGITSSSHDGGAVTSAFQMNEPIHGDPQFLRSILIPTLEPKRKEPSPSAELAHALVPFTATNHWARHPQTLRRWVAGSALEVAIGTGAGQEQSAFSVSLDGFAQECRDMGLSPAFLTKLVGKRSMFEYHLDLAPSGGSPRTLELAMSTYEDDAFTFLLRLDLEKQVGRALVFLKLNGSLRDADAPLSLGHFVEWLDRNKAALQRDPLLVANCVLTFYQYRSYSYVNWRKDLYDMESRLGVTERAAVFKKSGYQTLSFDYDKLNVDLARLSRRAAETSLSVSTTLHHATALLRLAELVENPKSSAGGTASVTTEEIRSTILRAELFLQNAAMANGLVESMRAVLYNRISKHDTNSMKTIAVVTLLFLPSTFVSSVFSTGVFDFHAGEEGDQPQTVSRWAWVYLLVCLLLTAVTLLLWLFWYRWGSLWLEKLHLTRAHVGHEEAQGQATGGKQQTTTDFAGEFERKDVEKGDGGTGYRRLDTRLTEPDSSAKLAAILMAALKEGHEPKEEQNKVV